MRRRRRIWEDAVVSFFSPLCGVGFWPPFYAWKVGKFQLVLPTSTRPLGFGFSLQFKKCYLLDQISVHASIDSPIFIVAVPLLGISNF
jgi:hypothetical protein